MISRISRRKRRSYSLLWLLMLTAWPTLALSQPPTRILSLDLCSDRMLAHHADPEQVLALSPLTRQYPLAWMGNDWPVHDGSLEQIVALKPDLVVTGEHNALLLRGRLQELGLKVAILPLAQDLEGITAYEQRFLAILGKQPRLASTPPPTDAPSSDAPRLLLLGANGIATGSNTFEDGILVRAGWRNYLQEEGYVSLDLERIINDPPDAILWSAPASAALANRFAEHPALKAAIPAERWLHSEYWRWQCPGPWSWGLIEELKRIRTEVQP